MNEKITLRHYEGENHRHLKTRVRDVYERIISPHHYQLIIPSFILGIGGAKALEYFTKLDLNETYTEASGPAFTAAVVGSVLAGYKFVTGEAADSPTKKRANFYEKVHINAGDKLRAFTRNIIRVRMAEFRRPYDEELEKARILIKHSGERNSEINRSFSDLRGVEDDFEDEIAREASILNRFSFDLRSIFQASAQLANKGVTGSTEGYGVHCLDEVCKGLLDLKGGENFETLAIDQEEIDALRAQFLQDYLSKYENFPILSDFESEEPQARLKCGYYQRYVVRDMLLTALERACNDEDHTCPDHDTEPRSVNPVSLHRRHHGLLSLMCKQLTDMYNEKFLEFLLYTGKERIPYDFASKAAAPKNQLSLHILNEERGRMWPIVAGLGLSWMTFIDPKDMEKYKFLDSIDVPLLLKELGNFSTEICATTAVYVACRVFSVLMPDNKLSEFHGVRAGTRMQPVILGNGRQPRGVLEEATKSNK